MYSLCSNISLLKDNVQVGTPTKRPISNDNSPINGPSKNLRMDQSVFSSSRKLVRSPVLQTTPAGSKNKENKTGTVNQDISTSNRFEILSDAKDNGTIEPASSKPKKLTKPPPICIVGASQFSQAIVIVNKITNDKNYFIKYMSIGVKLQVSSIDIFKTVTGELNKNNIKFYTHDIQCEKTTRYIISGLPDMDTTEINDELSSKNINPVKISKLTVKKPRFENEMIYLIHFVSNSISLKELQRIKAINHTIVTWKTHIQKYRGPTQCTRCQMFGHGGKNCHLNLNCRKCGGRHETPTCSETAVKCSNCNGDHQADDKDCPKKIAFMQMRQKLSTANQATKRVTYTKPRFEASDFPPLSAAPRQPNFWSAPSPQLAHFNRTISNQNLQQIGSNPDELFSHQEILAVTQEVLSGLRRCKSKEDQLNLIFSISIKFIYGSKP